MNIVILQIKGKVWRDIYAQRKNRERDKQIKGARKKKKSKHKKQQRK